MMITDQESRFRQKETYRYRKNHAMCNTAQRKIRPSHHLTHARPLAQSFRGELGLGKRDVCGIPAT